MPYLNYGVVIVNRIGNVTGIVAARLRKAGLQGPADILEWTALHHDAENLFLAAERCVEACVSAELLPTKPPQVMSKALSAARDAGMALVIGMGKGNGSTVQAPTGFGMAFAMSGRSARILVPEVVSAGLALWCGKDWGDNCCVGAWGAVPGVEPPGYSPTLPLLPVPSTEQEGESFGILVERLMHVGIPWVAPMDSMASPRVQCEMACRMLFHAAGHVVRGNDTQCGIFLAAAVREAAA